MIAPRCHVAMGHGIGRGQRTHAHARDEANDAAAWRHWTGCCVSVALAVRATRVRPKIDGDPTRGAARGARRVWSIGRSTDARRGDIGGTRGRRSELCRRRQRDRRVCVEGERGERGSNVCRAAAPRRTPVWRMRKRMPLACGHGTHRLESAHMHVHAWGERVKWGKIGWRLVDECVQCDVCGEGWDTRLMRDGDAVMRVERSIGNSLPQRGRVLSAIHAHPLHWRDG